MSRKYSSAISIGCFVVALLLVWQANSLLDWGEKHLNPCCNKICGSTVGGWECYPNSVAAYMVMTSLLIIGIGVCNIIVNLDLKKTKDE